MQLTATAPITHSVALHCRIHNRPYRMAPRPSTVEHTEHRMVPTVKHHLFLLWVNVHCNYTVCDVWLIWPISTT